MASIKNFISGDDGSNADLYRIHKLPNKQDLQHMSADDIVKLVDLLCNDCVSDFNVRMNQNQFMTNLALELTNRLKKDGAYKASKVKYPKDDPKLQDTSDIKKNNSDEKSLYDHRRDTVESRVAIILVEHLGVEPDKVVLSANIQEDLGADSLDEVELVMAFEEEFDIEIPDEVAQGVTTVEEAIKYIKSNVKP